MWERFLLFSFSFNLRFHQPERFLEMEPEPKISRNSAELRQPIAGNKKSGSTKIFT